MTDFVDLLPLYQETVATVRGRLDADINGGLTADDPAWIDIREGSWFFDITQPFVMECARLWDAIGSEVVAATFPALAWGQYLDYHAATFGLVREIAQPATGTVLFTGQDGAAVTAGTVVSAEASDEDADDVAFTTTVSGTMAGQIAAPSAPIATTSNAAGGYLPPGTYRYSVTALSGFGETDGSPEVGAVLNDSGSVTLDWADVTNAQGYRVYRGVVAGGPKQRIAEVATSVFTDNGMNPLGVSGPPSVNMTAGVRLPVRAATEGIAGNLPSYAITSLDTPNDAIGAVTNEEPTTGGTDLESDERLRERVLAHYTASGGGTIADYERWALEDPGVGRVFVDPVADGPGTVRVVVMQDNGEPVGATVVARVQQLLDPVPALGQGLAPIGHLVTVQTVSTRAVAVQATVTPQPGYSLDGGAGTAAIRSDIEAALAAYINGLDVGEDVVYEHVKAQFFTVRGVYNVTDVLVEGGQATIDIPSDPPTTARYAAPASLLPG